MLNRRDFSKIITVAIGMPALIVTSCKKVISSTNYALTKPQTITLKAVHEHLFPSETNRPGAKDINSTVWIKKLLLDPQIKNYKKRLQLQGVNWVSETAKSLFNSPFHQLSHSQKEAVLQDLMRYDNGEKWISQNITFILEALLADPIYEVNVEQKGWKWLKHKPGYPRPTIHTKYPYL